MTLSGRAALAWIAVAALTCAPSIALAQSQLTTVRVGIIPAVVCAQAFVAEDLGLFKKYGLDVEFQPMNNGVSTMAALVGGSLDIAFGDAVAVSSAHLRDVPLEFIAPGPMDTPQAPALALLVKADGPIRQAKDLDGHTIAVNAIKGMSTLTISAWIDGNGGDSKSVHFVEYPIPVMAAAVENGSVAAAFPPEPFSSDAIRSGAVHALVLGKGGLTNFMLAGWISSNSWLTSNPQTAAKFIAAIREAGDLVNRRPVSADVAAILTKYTKVPMPVIAQLEFFAANGQILDPGQLQPLIDAAARYGVIDKRFPAGEIVYRPK